MRPLLAAVLLPVLLFVESSCRAPKNQNPLRPKEAAVQITIPSAPGWSPSTNDTGAYGLFDRVLDDRLRTAPGVVTRKTWHQLDLSSVVTLYGDSPEAILVVVGPYLKRASLPAGTTVIKYYGAKDPNREEDVPLAQQP